MVYTDPNTWTQIGSSSAYLYNGSNNMSPSYYRITNNQDTTEIASPFIYQALHSISYDLTGSNLTYDTGNGKIVFVDPAGVEAGNAAIASEIKLLFDAAAAAANNGAAAAAAAADATAAEKAAVVAAKATLIAGYKATIISNVDTALAVYPSGGILAARSYMDAAEAAYTLLETAKADADTAHGLVVGAAPNGTSAAQGSLTASTASIVSLTADYNTAYNKVVLLVTIDGGVDGDDHVPVRINLNVEINANSSLTVLGETVPAVSNVADAEYRLPVDALYDGANSKGLLEMWEPADAPGEIKVRFAATDSSAVAGGADLSRNGGVWKETIRKLGRGLHKVLVNPLDCSSAMPFSDPKYVGVVEYTKQRDFGRLALGAFAHFFFGHVDATAAITNDATFVANMLSITEAAAVDETAGGAAARYDAWSKKTQVETGDFSAWTSATTPAGSDRKSVV